MRSVPDIWKGADAAGENGQGAGTYRLRVLLPPERPELAIRYTTVSTAFELDVDGIQIAHAGSPAVDPNRASPGCRPGVVPLGGANDELNLDVRVSNHEYRSGGMWRSFRLGERYALQNAKNTETVVSIILFAFFIAVSFNSAIIFLFRKKERSQLYFALFTFVLALRPLVTGEYPIVQALPLLPFSILIRSVYLTSFLPVPLAVLFVSSLYPDLLSRNLKRILVLPAAPFILFAIVAPLPFLTRVIFVFYAVALFCVAALYFGVLIRAAAMKRPGAAALSISAAAMLAAGINDVLYASFVVDTAYALPYGLAAMVVVQTTVLSRRFTRAFDLVEELSGNLSRTNRNLETEIEQRIAVQKRLEDSLAEKTVLLRNVHHWVRNSLQMVSSLVSLETNRTEEELQRKRLATLKARIQSISLVHDRLYESGAADSLELGSFTRELADILIACYDGEYDTDIRFDIDSVRVPAKTCIDFGLILAELVSNSFKFAVIPRGSGRIRIEAVRENDDLVLRYADDGPGFPPGFSPEKQKTMGYRMLMRMVSVNSGSCRLLPDEAALVEIRLRLPPGS